MSAAQSARIVYDGDPASLTLSVLGPRKPALAGAPVESVSVLHRDDDARCGVWECTPGRFASARSGDNELMHFVSGAGTITSSDGSVFEIHPGAVLIAPDGWAGEWNIRETVRKVYTIWNTKTVGEAGNPS
ncbi:cupin domain-containing protein [Microbacterium sediminicola]|uniref:Cupin domain-containing protein n=1 Tax=Microbacterium sediminicola TaxID=415210 RepID=A0ABP4TR08_9MICO